ncbi:MAG TPA: phosphohistidine phosphatase SixA [Verrucomicrobiae bacterium]
MNLFLLRHGIAAERGTPGHENDFDRALTPKGKEQLRTVAAAARAMELRFDAILSSPLVRARQTAEIIAAELKLKKHLTLADELKPGGAAKKLVQKISGLKPSPENVLLVGHEPDFSELISLFITGHTGGGFALRKGGLVKLEIEKLRAGKCALLAWLLTPAQMKLMR